MSKKDFATVILCKEGDPSKTMSVNAATYATDLGKARYKGWKIKKERRAAKKQPATVDAKKEGVPGKISQEEYDHIPKAKTPDEKVKPKEKKEFDVEEISPEEKGIE